MPFIEKKQFAALLLLAMLAISSLQGVVSSSRALKDESGEQKENKEEEQEEAAQEEEEEEEEEDDDDNEERPDFGRTEILPEIPEEVSARRNDTEEFAAPEDLEGVFAATREGQSDCNITAVASAEANSDASESISRSVSEAFAEIDGCDNARASARAKSAAISTAVARATAGTRVEVLGDCPESALARATAIGTADATALANAVVLAVAEASNGNEEAIEVARLEKTEEAIVEAIAESQSVITGETSSDNGGVSANKTIETAVAEAIVEIVAEAAAVAFCDEDEVPTEEPSSQVIQSSSGDNETVAASEVEDVQLVTADDPVESIEDSNEKIGLFDSEESAARSFIGIMQTVCICFLLTSWVQMQSF